MADRILMVAGEASADAHGAQVLRALKRQRPELVAFGVGGALMRAEGFAADIDADRMAVAGLTEVVCALPRLLGYMRRLVRLARALRPQVAILIDHPDFNVRLARRLKALGIRVVYYISPQVWAWRSRRVHAIRAVVDQMLVILPFEETFYQAHGVPVRFVGHPLVEQVPARPDMAGARRALGVAEDAPGPVVALLPGSRVKEVARHLPAMLDGLRGLRRDHPAAVGVLPVASTIDRPWLEAQVARAGLPVTVVDGQATLALSAADVAVVCSGTATLQAALLQRPMVVVYRVSWLTYRVLRRLVRVSHIALVNLIAGEALVPELVQDQLTAVNVARALGALWSNEAHRARLKERLGAMRAALGSGNTAHEVAAVVAQYLPPVATPIPKDTLHAS